MNAVARNCRVGYLFTGGVDRMVDDDGYLHLSIIRATYHLYQGWDDFIGNIVMGYSGLEFSLVAGGSYPSSWRTPSSLSPSWDTPIWLVASAGYKAIPDTQRTCRPLPVPWGS